VNLEAKQHEGREQDWTATVVDNLEDIERIRPVWEQMHSAQSYPTLNAEVGRFTTFVRNADRQVTPHIVLVSHGDRAVAMIIGRIEKAPLSCKIGYKSLWSPELKRLAVVYGGVIGQLDRGVCEFIVEHLFGILSSGVVDVVFFNHLPVDSLIYKAARSAPTFLCRDYFPVVEPHWRTAVANSPDEFWAGLSSSRKRYLKRYMGKLETKTDGAIRIEVYRDEAEVDSFMDVASQISHLTYKAGAGFSFDDTPLNRSLIRQAAKSGMWSGHVLFAGEQPCAFDFGVRCGSNYVGQHIGYDPQWSSCSPGTVLFIKLLEELSKDPFVRNFDFGFGPSEYKDRFGTDSWPEASLYLFAPKLRPVLVNSVRSVLTGGSLVAIGLLRRLCLLGVIKRRWRETLQAKSAR